MTAAYPAPDRDPIVEEGRRLLEEDPELRADLEEFGARLERDEVTEAELIPHSEVLRRLGATRSADERESEVCCPMKSEHEPRLDRQESRPEERDHRADWETAIAQARVALRESWPQNEPTPRRALEASRTMRVLWEYEDTLRASGAWPERYPSRHRDPTGLEQGRE